MYLRGKQNILIFHSIALEDTELGCPNFHKGTIHPYPWLNDIIKFSNLGESFSYL